jgi:hypothetical protein
MLEGSEVVEAVNAYRPATQKAPAPRWRFAVFCQNAPIHRGVAVERAPSILSGQVWVIGVHQLTSGAAWRQAAQSARNTPPPRLDKTRPRSRKRFSRRAPSLQARPRSHHADGREQRAVCDALRRAFGAALAEEWRSQTPCGTRGRVAAATRTRRFPSTGPIRPRPDVIAVA